MFKMVKKRGEGSFGDGNRMRGMVL